MPTQGGELLICRTVSLNQPNHCFVLVDSKSFLIAPWILVLLLLQAHSFDSTAAKLTFYITWTRSYISPQYKNSYSGPVLLRVTNKPHWLILMQSSLVDTQLISSCYGLLALVTVNEISCQG